MKEQTNKARFWKLLEQFGYEVDDGERRLPIKNAPGMPQRFVTKDQHGIADLTCIPKFGSKRRGMLYFQVAWSNSDHDSHLHELLSDEEKRRKLVLFLAAGNSYQVGSYNNDSQLGERRITVAVLSRIGCPMFYDIDAPDEDLIPSCRPRDLYTIEHDSGKKVDLG